MYSAYKPRAITKESILSASPSQLEMLLQHVVLVKDSIVPKKFQPVCVTTFNFLNSNSHTQTIIKTNSR